MKCSTCGKMGCYAHGGDVKERGINRQDDHRSNGTSEAGHYAKYRTSNEANGIDDGSRKWTNSKAKEKHHGTLGEMRALPKPKLQGLAKGGEVGDDNGTYERINPDRAAQAQKGAQTNEMDDIVAGAKSMFGNLTGMGAEAQPVHKAEGGEIDGDMGDDDDDELMHMCVDELKDGLKSGDNKQIIESLKAIFMSMKG